MKTGMTILAAVTTAALLSLGTASQLDAGVVSYLRWGAGQEMMVILNLTPVVRRGYRVGAPRPGYYREVLNSDAAAYGGGNLGNGGGVHSQDQSHHGQPFSLELTLPPLAALVLKNG